MEFIKKDIDEFKEERYKGRVLFTCLNCDTLYNLAKKKIANSWISCCDCGTIIIREHTLILKNTKLVDWKEYEYLKKAFNIKESYDKKK